MQLFIGLSCLRAFTEKIASEDWWTGATIDQFLVEHNGMPLQWYQLFIDSVVAPNTSTVATVVLVAQLFAAVTLLSGRSVAEGLTVGMFLNLSFLTAGAASPSAFYLLAQGAVGLWLAHRHLHRPAVRLKLEVATAAGSGLRYRRPLRFARSLLPT
ncbi:MAG: hypothetical protein EX269_10005 [Acidimicrobiales bacterium]|nr:MAG: hypothetical protein EX269_10005 [Acidimicrobiales bacterium]